MLVELQSKSAIKQLLYLTPMVFSINVGSLTLFTLQDSSIHSLLLLLSLIMALWR
jgi:hypothetical protein